MGQEESDQRKLVFEVPDQRRRDGRSHPGAMVQHCLPATGEEITGEVFEAHADEIFDEAGKPPPPRKAVLYLLMQ